MIKYLVKLPSTGRWCGLVVKELVGQPAPLVTRFPNHSDHPDLSSLIILIVNICHLARIYLNLKVLTARASFSLENL